MGLSNEFHLEIQVQFLSIFSADFSSSHYTRENWLVSDFVNGSEYFNLKIKYVKKTHKKFPKNPYNNKHKNPNQTKKPSQH